MKIAVVGGCASGKSTISARLRELGHDAYVVGQEHSDIADLWRRQSPECLVYLETSLESVRDRRGPAWPEWLFHRQHARLEPARAAADVIISTDDVSVDESIRTILERIDGEG